MFEKLNIQDLEKTIEDKFEQCCKAKELGEGIWLGGDHKPVEVARATLGSLIAEMKTEQPPPPPLEPQQPPPTPCHKWCAPEKCSWLCKNWEKQRCDDWCTPTKCYRFCPKFIS